MDASVTLVVPRIHVKRVKTALEMRQWLDRKIKIKTTPLNEQPEGSRLERMSIPTTIPFLQEQSHDQSLVQAKQLGILKELSLDDLSDEIDFVCQTKKNEERTDAARSPFSAAILKALNDLPSTLLEALDMLAEDLANAFPTTYSIYKPMLLLPPNAFDAQPWKKLLSSYPLDSDILHPIWDKLASSMGVTHIAINAGIPINKASPETTAHSDENILRSPINLTPLFGSFGPQPNAQRLSNPTPEDFASALWVSTSQNGIHQSWAPLYTMFSRGNIREKTRLLTLPSIRCAVNEGKDYTGVLDSHYSAPKPGCTAVDLYAGIGYFAFSYRKAGVSKVLCWELNPWSIEGLRRGATRNNWSTRICSSPRIAKGQSLQELKDQVQDVDFVIFQESNEEALGGVAALTFCEEPGTIPPVRHVNLGFLPSSKLSWRTAVKIIDAKLGGWVHAHENVGIEDIESRKDEVVKEMQGYLDSWDGERGVCGYLRKVKWEHTEKIKTYAPGVWHVVFDIWVGGVKDAEDPFA